MYCLINEERKETNICEEFTNITGRQGDRKKYPINKQVM
jgi:hypothetical protein